MSEIRELVNKKIDGRLVFKEGLKFNIRSDGAVMKIKSLCDEMLNGRLSRISRLPEILIAVQEIKENEIAYLEFKKYKPWINKEDESNKPPPC